MRNSVVVLCCLGVWVSLQLANAVSLKQAAATQISEADAKKLVQSLGSAENQIHAVAVASAGMTAANGSELSILFTMDNAETKARTLVAGGTLSGADCLTVATNIHVAVGQAVGQAIAQSQNAGNSSAAVATYPAPVAGEAAAQNALLTVGAAYVSILGSAGQNVNATSPGQYLSLMLQLNSDVGAVAVIIAQNDTSSNCQVVIKSLAQDLLNSIAAVNA